MITFSIPHDSGFKSFSVPQGSVLFAGSRNIIVPHQTCRDLVSAFGGLGFSFLTGCASGVDSSFRQAFAESRYRDSSIIACAFRERAERLKGVYSLFVVPDGLPPRVALAKRTLWMTSRCSILILFPSDPVGRGSHLAFKSAILNSKPVFIVTKTRPAESSLYTVLSSNLFGVVDGFWCVPPVYADTGLCCETS
jgi:hypothetical protein